jgi:hypothetical protein
MSYQIVWIAAEAERPERIGGVEFPRRRRRGQEQQEQEERERAAVRSLPAHQFSAQAAEMSPVAQSPTPQEQERDLEEIFERDRQLRVYRARTVSLLRRYMKYSIETGRLPSLLGKEFFRAKVTAYTVVTFEDRVIFVHDMEKCVERLDEFSRQLIARHILQEHDRWATAKLLHCNEKTVRRYTPMALDLLSEILLEVGMLQRLDSKRENSCQGGKTGPFSASDCEDGEYKV